jgi:hypothetical protein
MEILIQTHMLFLLILKIFFSLQLVLIMQLEEKKDNKNFGIFLFHKLIYNLIIIVKNK